MDNNEKRNFFCTTAGYYTLSAILFVVIFGITLLLWNSATEASYVVILICSVFGWITLNKIQPTMFLWMSWIGWLIYFVIKFVLSALIGLFVAPFTIARWIATLINNAVE